MNLFHPKLSHMKNKIFKYTGFILLLTIFGSMAGCLKNNQYYVDLSKVSPSIQLPLAAANLNGVVTFSFNVSNTPDTIPVYVNVASPSPLSTSVTATLGLDTAYLNQYNQNNGTNYQLLPDSTYSITGWNLTVPAGQRLAFTNVIIYTTKINASYNYILPITIVNSSLPIENWNHLLLNILAKNSYDGVYDYRGRVVDPNRPQLSNDFNDNAGSTSVYLITAGTSSVTQYWPAVSANAIPLWNSSSNSISYYGYAAPLYTIDPNTNQVTSITNSYLNPPNGRTITINNAVNNYYDPNTRTIYASFIMNQPGFAPVTIYDTLTYTGPRP
ncbi:uncharacterized protein DUF1735 [Thermoflavifilum aggregans]|uniref:Uncharacterized protein DUF1735 n=2 Tax=Thermoflavifilum aggregans TaxID=454188 RepID=A0A2M9CWU4_9BACT|nr:uncharacterized protein DUF1735 [Thermoflavifilum aggregans]